MAWPIPRRAGHRLLAAVAAACIPAGAFAQAGTPARFEIRSPDDLRALESRVREVAARVRPSVVGILMPPPKDAPGAPDGGSGSGIVISADGWVLTAGHVGQSPGRAVTVLLADGSEAKGLTYGQHFGPDGDVGLVKIEAAGRELPFVELGAAQSLPTGTPVIALGHPLGPERSPWRPPPLRVGRVIGRDGWLLAIDAPLSPGDSGGGVFDLDGRLVGVNSAASERPDLNLAATAERAQSLMQSMKEGLATGAWLSDPEKDPIEASAEWYSERRGDDGAPARPGDAEQERRDQYERRAAALEALAPLSDPYADAIVTVIVDSRDACHGVFVDEEGHVLTKASELGTGARRIDILLNDGLSVQGKRVAVDRDLDLALVATSSTDATPVDFADAPEPALGDAVVTVGRGMAPMALGFRSLGRYVSGSSDAACRAYLGIAMRRPSDDERAALPGGLGQMVVSVAPGGSAAQVGIKEGDAIVRIDGVPIDSPEAAAAPLRTHAPGESATVEVWSGGAVRTLEVRLLRPTWIDVRANAGGPVSRRATGFGEVIQHDGVVPANSVGTPIVDSQGRVVGLNIARADRMKTYALPSARVAASVRDMLARVAAGEVLAEEDPAAGLAAARFAADGFARLEPADARAVGPTAVVLAGEPPAKPAAIGGWADVDDAAFWRIEIPSMGRYDVALEVKGLAGGKVDVFFGNDLMTVSVPRGMRDFARVRVGESVAMEGGTVTVRLQPLGRPVAPMMELRAVVVQRTDLLRAVEQAMPLMRFRDMERFKREFEREKRRRERQEDAR
jgi:serine protease Do